ncbi:MAG: M23 family metallopeptidase [Dehalococcoidia bacterium]|jgi:murein DD-endopeptidase MepM/ murein hydrolase activator NlpD
MLEVGPTTELIEEAGVLIRTAAALVAITSLFGLALVACGGGGATATPTQVLKIVTRAASPTAGEPDLTGFAFPLAGACLPSGDQLMPGAPRDYRQGTHEGIDFYDSDNCTSIGVGTPVLAAKAGTVVRADWDYTPLTQDVLDQLQNETPVNGQTDEHALDLYRGRQVWIDHGNGVVTRYAHLSRIADGINVGVSVSQGQLIAYVGNTGTPESVTDPNAEMHLHFEIRVGDVYLGKGLSPSDVRSLYEKALGVK